MFAQFENLDKTTARKVMDEVYAGTSNGVYLNKFKMKMFGYVTATMEKNDGRKNSYSVRLHSIKHRSLLHSVASKYDGEVAS